MVGGDGPPPAARAKVLISMRKASFRIRRVYFDQIVSGVKKEEIRSYTPFWFKRLLAGGQPEVAVFLCGRDVHRRRIKRVYIEIPEKVLGRPLSPQGMLDLTTETCIIVELGEEFIED